VGLTNSGGFYVDTGSGQGGSTVTIGGALTDSGTLQLGPGDFSLSSPDQVTAAGLNNTGTINLYGNATEGTTNQATLDITSGAAPATWIGAANLAGDALLEFASGQITSIAAGATLTLNNLNGAQSRVADASDTTSNSALTQLASNTGTFEIVNDAGLADQATSTLTNSGTFVLEDITSFSTLAGVGFANSGPFYVDNGSGQGGSTVTTGGTLTKSGYIQIGTGNQNLSAPTTVTATTLTNTTTGTITLIGNATAKRSRNAVGDLSLGDAKSGQSAHGRRPLVGSRVLWRPPSIHR